MLGYTSGTSGRPRGAMLSHRALLANLRAVRRAAPAPVTAERRGAAGHPALPRVRAERRARQVCWRGGATGVLVDRFDPAGTLELIAGTGVTAVAGVPAMFALLDRRARPARPRPPACGWPPPARRRCRRDAARASPQAGHADCEGYGLTEAAPVRHLDAGRRPPEARLGRPGDARGRAAAAWTSRRRPDDEAGPGESTWSDRRRPGRDRGPRAEPVLRLLAGRRGRAGRRGLVARPATWLPRRRRRPAPGRPAATLVIVSGFNVYPAEVEEVLAAHPGVAEAAVVGRPDPERGDETVLAYWSPRPVRRRPSRSCWTGRRGRWPGSSCRRRSSSCRSCRTPPTGKVIKARLAPSSCASPRRSGVAGVVVLDGEAGGVPGAVS